MLDEYIHNLAEALKAKDYKRRDKILADLRKLHMDDSTALMLALHIMKEEGNKA